MTDPDDIRSGLHDAASSIEAGDPETALGAVHASARRRTRRRTAGTALAGIVVVAGAAVGVLAVTDGQPDTLVSTDDTAAPEPSVDLAAPSATDAPEVGAPSTSADVPRASLGAPVELVDQPWTAGAANGEDGSPEFGEWAVRWRGGFLVGSGISQAQPLPTEWPDDIAALFPPEVIELYRDRPPATVDEATTILSEAGLLETVSDILRDNPDGWSSSTGSPQRSRPSPMSASRPTASRGNPSRWCCRRALSASPTWLQSAMIS